jgi:hypothetical protein
MRVSLKDLSNINTLATSQPQPMTVALDGTYAYWTNMNNFSPGQGSVVRATVDGSGLPLPVNGSFDRPWGIALDGKYAYWTESSPGTLKGSVFSWLLDGSSNPTPIVEGLAEPGPIAAYGDVLYFAETKGPSVDWANYNQPFVVHRVAAKAAPTSIAVDESGVYWTIPADGTVWRAELDLTNALQIAVNQKGANAIALDKNAVYWATSSSILKLAK